MKSILALFLLMMMGSSISSAEQMTGMDWKRGEISAIGIGVPPERAISKAQGNALACRAAKLDALRNLLETSQGVRVDSVTLVKDAMVESDLIRSAVKGLVKGAREENRRLMPDESCEVRLVMPVAGQMFSALISEEEYYKRVGDNRSSKVDFSERMQELASYLAEYGLVGEAHAGIVPEIKIEDDSQLKLAKQLMETFSEKGDQLASTLMLSAIRAYEEVSGFTGIVIDASHLPTFSAAMLPLIRDHEGRKLYPNKNTTYEVATSRMPFSYEMNVNDAMTSDRVANKPLVIKATSTYKSKRSDLVLDEAGVKRFVEVIQQGSLDKKAKIMIVLAD